MLARRVLGEWILDPLERQVRENLKQLEDAYAQLITVPGSDIHLQINMGRVPGERVVMLGPFHSVEEIRELSEMISSTLLEAIADLRDELQGE